MSDEIKTIGVGPIGPVGLSQVESGELTIEKAIQAMKTGMLPINTANTNTTPIVMNVFDLLEECGDLLAIGQITPHEWTRLKGMLKSQNMEDIHLVKKILHAKSGL